MHNIIITHCHCHSYIYNIVCMTLSTIYIQSITVTLTCKCMSVVLTFSHACNLAGVASPSGNMTAVFTLGSLLGVLVVIATVVILGIIICLCACRRKQKAKDTGKSVLYTVQVVFGCNSSLSV